MSTGKANTPSDTYRQEASELLTRLESALLEMDGNGSDPELINEAFRALHTIKGSGAMFGFDDIADFAHHFENAFERVRNGDVAPSAALIDASLKAVDQIRGLLEGAAAPEEGASILTALEAAVGDSAAPAGSRASPRRVPAEARSGPKTFRIVFYPAADALRFGTNPLLMFEELRALGELGVSMKTERVPPIEDLDPTACYLGWELYLTTDADRSAVEDVFMFVAETSELEIEEVEMAPEMSGKPEKTRQSLPAKDGAGTRANRKPAAAESIRVSADRLDSLMDQVGELVIAQSRLADLAGKLNDVSLRAVSEDIERLATNLRDETLGIRMLPIGLLFSRFRRVVRDLSGELGKDIDFVTVGEDTEVDKTFIDELSDPLVHLIRNSIDHGIEDAATRRARGKPAKGRLELEAVQSGGEVHIVVRDNGGGLDTEAIRARAVERGLVGADESLPDKQIQMMIFEAGFSTAESVSTVSGRGVGMDVVRRTIEKLRGTIDLHSEPGCGTTITLRLPLTLAIIEGFHVSVGGNVFVLPLDVVEECVELSGADDTASEGRSLISIRDQFVPFARLHDLFGLSYEADRDRRVVVVRVGSERVGLVVDAILGQRQTVIKPLSRLHRGVPGLAGATILGDGRVALILDMIAMLAMARSGTPERRSRERRSA